MADLHNMNREQWIASLVETAKRVGANVTETPHGLKVIAMYPGELAAFLEANRPVPVESLGRDADVHPDDLAVDRFAAAMKAKLADARAKGRGGWDDKEDLEQHLSNLLRDHVDKGDPRDVANFCCFLWNRGEAIAPAPLASVDDASDIRTVIDRGLWGVVANAGRLSNTRKPRWAHVSDATALGSQSSIELCRRFNFDPDENVGGDHA